MHHFAAQDARTAICCNGWATDTAYQRRSRFPMRMITHLNHTALKVNFNAGQAAIAPLIGTLPDRLNRV